MRALFNAFGNVTALQVAAGRYGRSMKEPGPLRRSKGAIIIDVWAVPGAAHTEIRGLHDGALRIRVAAPASGGQANLALERFLTKISGSRAVIVKGGSARRKQVRIENADLAAIAARLGLRST